MKVVIVDHSHEDCSTEVGILVNSGFEVAVMQVHDEADVIAALKDADAAIAEYGQFTERVFRALPNLKIVSNYAMGVDNIDVEAARPQALLSPTVRTIASMRLLSMEWR